MFVLLFNSPLIFGCMCSKLLFLSSVFLCTFLLEGLCVLKNTVYHMCPSLIFHFVWSFLKSPSFRLYYFSCFLCCGITVCIIQLLNKALVNSVHTVLQKLQVLLLSHQTKNWSRCISTRAGLQQTLLTFPSFVAWLDTHIPKCLVSNCVRPCLIQCMHVQMPVLDFLKLDTAVYVQCDYVLCFNVTFEPSPTRCISLQSGWWNIWPLI